jgi:hypothetical protein
MKRQLLGINYRPSLLRRKIQPTKADPTRNNANSRITARKHKRQELILIAKHDAMYEASICDQGYRHHNKKRRWPIEQKPSAAAGGNGNELVEPGQENYQPHDRVDGFYGELWGGEEQGKEGDVAGYG